MVPFFALNSAANEEKNRTLALLRGMPISPKRIVASKFVAALLVGVLWSLISVAVMLFGTRLFPGAVGRALPPTPFLGPYQMALTLPIAAVTLIAFFKWNSSAARTAIMVLWIALYVIPTVFRPAGISMTEFYMKIMSPTPSAISIVLAVSLAIYFLGMLVAQEIFARRELA
jgi:ABC-type transport system involved in multi-copper enzyme maturation permease subunit